MFGRRGVEGGPGPVGEDRHVPEADGEVSGSASRTEASTCCSSVEVLRRDALADPLQQFRGRAPARRGVLAGARTASSRSARACAGVGVDAERGVVGLQLPGVGLDLDDPAARGERVVVRGEFAEPRADDQQHVGVLQEVRGVPVLQPGPERERVLPGEGALAAEGGDDRGVDLLGEREQLAGGVGAYDSAARDDRRTLGVRQQVRRPRRSARVAGTARAGWRRAR